MQAHENLKFFFEGGVFSDFFVYEKLVFGQVCPVWYTPRQSEIGDLTETVDFCVTMTFDIDDICTISVQEFQMGFGKVIWIDKNGKPQT